MAAPSGISAQFMYKTETTPGTGVVVDKAQPFISESVKQDISRVESKGIRAGRRLAAVWKPGTKTIGGDIQLELTNKDIAPLLKHAWGVPVTTGSNPYTHTWSGVTSLTGIAFTAQIGRPDIAGTVQPFTWAGTKIANWELTASIGEMVGLKLGVSAMTESTATALAVASYTAGNLPFVFTEASLSIAGASVCVRDFTLTGDNGLAVDRFCNGGSTVKEQLESGLRSITGSATGDFESLTQYARYTAASEVALVAAFVSGADTLTITTNVRFDGESPNVTGIELLEQPMPFTAVSATSDAAAFSAVLVNTDTVAT